ncbi:MAG TPA: hypothetical protein VK983_05500 [Candidatus Limnocylindrales bacterium]|nr:hypothetical protein [Candidatus Limnocylindrales bacterium]
MHTPESRPGYECASEEQLRSVHTKTRDWLLPRGERVIDGNLIQKIVEIPYEDVQDLAPDAARVLEIGGPLTLTYDFPRLEVTPRSNSFVAPGDEEIDLLFYPAQTQYDIAKGRESILESETLFIEEAEAGIQTHRLQELKPDLEVPVLPDPLEVQYSAQDNVLQEQEEAMQHLSVDETNALEQIIDQLTRRG